MFTVFCCSQGKWNKTRTEGEGKEKRNHKTPGEATQNGEFGRDDCWSKAKNVPNKQKNDEGARCWGGRLGDVNPTSRKASGS